MTTTATDRINPWQARAVAFRVGEQMGIPLDSWTAMVAAVVHQKVNNETAELFVMAAAQEADRRGPGGLRWTDVAQAVYGGPTWRRRCWIASVPLEIQARSTPVNYWRWESTQMETWTPDSEPLKGTRCRLTLLCRLLPFSPSPTSTSPTAARRPA